MKLKKSQNLWQQNQLNKRNNIDIIIFIQFMSKNLIRHFLLFSQTVIRAWLKNWNHISKSRAQNSRKKSTLREVQFYFSKVYINYNIFLHAEKLFPFKICSKTRFLSILDDQNFIISTNFHTDRAEWCTSLVSWPITVRVTKNVVTVLYSLSTNENAVIYRQYKHALVSSIGVPNAK